MRNYERQGIATRIFIPLPFIAVYVEVKQISMIQAEGRA
jgi:hypothetical protein